MIFFLLVFKSTPSVSKLEEGHQTPGLRHEVPESVRRFLRGYSGRRTVHIRKFCRGVPLRARVGQKAGSRGTRGRCRRGTGRGWLGPQRAAGLQQAPQLSLFQRRQHLNYITGGGNHLPGNILRVSK